MRCPYCGSTDSRVTDSRATGEGIRRRRECLSCGVRFTTYERIQSTALVVAKRDGRREEFDRGKLSRSIRLACVKRPLPTGTLEKAVDEIEAGLQRLGRAEVPTAIIGELTIGKLRELDRVAYIRYASVYRDFDDVAEFEREIAALQEAMQDAPRPSTESQLSLIPNQPTVPPRPRARRGRRPRISAPRARGGAANPEK